MREPLQLTYSWDEALYTKELLGLSDAQFARLIGCSVSAIASGRKNPQRLLRYQTARLLELGVNRINLSRIHKHQMKELQRS